MGRQLEKKWLDRYIKKHKKNGSIVVWKIVRTTKGEYYAPYKRIKYCDVCNARRGFRSNPMYGVHAFRNESSAKRWWGSGDYTQIVQCRIKPKWVIAIGHKNAGYSYKNPWLMQTLTASHMVMPKYPSKTVSLKRFRAVCKEHKI